MWKKYLLVLFLILSVPNISKVVLIDRGNGLVYDAVLDVTWLRDAGLAQTSGYDGDGLMTWPCAREWVDSLNTNAYWGLSNWRLPKADVNRDGVIVDCLYDSAEACIDNETGYMFYHNHISTFSSGLFTNVSFTYYWTGTECSFLPTSAWTLRFDYGYQGWHDKEDVSLAVWVVHDGDVSAVPLPVALWLFIAGGLVLSGVRLPAK